MICASESEDFIKIKQKSGLEPGKESKTLFN